MAWNSELQFVPGQPYILLTFGKTRGSTLANKHHRAPITRGTPCLWPHQGGPESAGHGEGRGKLATPKAPRNRKRRPGSRRHGRGGQAHTRGLPTRRPCSRLAEDVPALPRAAGPRPRQRPSWIPCATLSPPPKPGGDATDTHAGFVSQSGWPEIRRCRRHAGSWPLAAGPARRGARRQPWPRRRQAGWDTRRPEWEGRGCAAATAQVASACPAPRVKKQKTRGPAKSGLESNVQDHPQIGKRNEKTTTRF